MKVVRFGTKELFQLTVKIVYPIDPKWVFGNLIFEIKNQQIGDWNDLVSVKACYNWMNDFLEYKIERKEPLIETNMTAVFEYLYNSIFKNFENAKKLYYSKYSIAHLGMSSFNDFSVFLIETDLYQRVIWKNQPEYGINEVFFPPYTLQQVIKEFCIWFTHNYVQNEQNLF